MTTYKTGGIGLAGPAIIIGILVGLIAAQLMPVQSKPQPASAATFDHSNCQYPERWSNPVDGCDNSDPAVPECIKGITTKEAEDACIAAFTAQYQGTAEKQQEIIAHDKAFNTAQPQAAQCGGK